eukprot:tig00000056_g24078.t1
MQEAELEGDSSLGAREHEGDAGDLQLPRTVIARLKALMAHVELEEDEEVREGLQNAFRIAQRHIECSCTECSRPEARRRLWACRFRCECPQCVEARSPTAQPTSGLCDESIIRMDLMTSNIEKTQPLPDFPGFEACRSLWQSDLDRAIAEGGEKTLASVAYGLRLAWLFGLLQKFEEARPMLKRFLAPRLLHPKRIDELIGAASPGLLVTCAMLYGRSCFADRDFASAKRCHQAAVYLIKRFTDCDDDDKYIVDNLWYLMIACVCMRDRSEAWTFYQLAVRSDRSRQRLGSQCCLMLKSGWLVGLSSMFYSFDEDGCRDSYREAEAALQTNLEIAEGSCRECKARGYLGFALKHIGILILKKWQPGAEEGEEALLRAESYLKRALVELELEGTRDEDKSLGDVLRGLGSLHLRAGRLGEAAVCLCRGLVVVERYFGLAHDSTESCIENLLELLSRRYEPTLARLCARKSLAFIRETGRPPAGLGTGGKGLRGVAQTLETALATGELHCLVLDREPHPIGPAPPAPAAGPGPGRTEPEPGRAALDRRSDQKLDRRVDAGEPDAGLGRTEPDRAAPATAQQSDPTGRRAALDGRRREEAARERARQEAERDIRAEREAADRTKARELMQRLKWPRARSLLDALLKREPGDAEARLLRIQCMAGAGQLEAAAAEAGGWEKELQVRQEREKAEAELRRRREAAQRAEEDEEEEERREAEELERRRREREREREEEAEAKRAAEERTREERRREAAAAAAEAAAAEAARRNREQEARRDAPPCRFFARGACRDGERCRFRHQPEASSSSSSGRPRRLCRHFARGFCALGASCRFAHPATPSTGTGIEPGAPHAHAVPALAEGECAICLEPAPPAGDASVISLPCSHRFHAECIGEWRSRPLATGCPECRAPFDAGAGADPSESPAPPADPGAAPSALEPPAGPDAPLAIAPEAAPPAPEPPGGPAPLDMAPEFEFEAAPPAPAPEPSDTAASWPALPSAPAAGPGPAASTSDPFGALSSNPAFGSAGAGAGSGAGRPRPGPGPG